MSRIAAPTRRTLLARCAVSKDDRIAHFEIGDTLADFLDDARAFVAGALAGLVGRTMIYVSGGAEHQGPPGGGPVALIVER